MDYYEMISEAIEFIDDNIRSDINLDDLAKRYYCSKFHFHRIFQSYVEKPVIQYVKDRKMALSTLQILHSKKKIVDIAYEMGFHSHAAFTRLFKTYYSISPEECRKYKIYVPVYEKIRIIKEKIDIPMPSYLTDPVILEIDEFEVVGVQTECDYDTNIKNDIIPKFWNKFMTKLNSIPDRTQDFFTSGIAWDTEIENRFNYFAGIKVNNSERYKDGNKRWCYHKTIEVM